LKSLNTRHQIRAVVTGLHFLANGLLTVERMGRDHAF
jgi:hypothetical protein